MAGVINTTYSFTATDLVTSTKLNNLIDETVFTTDAYDGTTITIGSGKLKVATGGITSNEIAANAVVTAGILDGAVTAGKLATDAVETLKIKDANVTAAKLASDAVTTAKILNANVTAAKLSGAQTGSAPIYGARAWCSFQGRGTNGAATINASGNVTSVTRTAEGRYTVVMTTALPDANYAFSGAAEDSVGDVIVSSVYAAKSTTSFGISIKDSANNSSDPDICNFIVIR